MGKKIDVDKFYAEKVEEYTRENVQEKTGSGIVVKIRNFLVRLRNRGKPKGNIIVIQRTCSLCGEKFVVKIERRTGKILTDCFYGGKIRLGVGMWAAYQFMGYDKKKDKIIHKRCISWYRYVWYTLKDWKRLLFHQYHDTEYWECPKCFRACVKKMFKRAKAWNERNEK